MLSTAGCTTTSTMTASMSACSTTMGVMGVAEEDLIDGCDIAGAAAFLDFAGDADVQLFV